MKFRDLQVGDWFDFIAPNRSHNSFFKRVEKTGPRTYRDEQGTKYRVGSISVQVYHIGGRWHANNPRRRKRRANPHRRRARPTLRESMHVRAGARGLTEREARRLAQFERRYDRLVGRSPNPRKRHRKRRSQNPRSPLFKLLAQRAGGKRLVYLGGMKFAEKGRPVYFKTPDGARTVAKLLRLQFPMLKRYAFAVAGA